MRYYQIVTDDDSFPDRWFLDEPLAIDGVEIDAREFTYGTLYRGPIPATVPIQYPGRTVAFNLAAFDMPVVTTKIAQLIDNLAPGEVQRFPVRIDGTSGYEILNVVCTEHCVDETQSEVLKWGPEDGRPDKIGKYRMLTRLTIDPNHVHHHIFRIKDWEVALIASDLVKSQLGKIDDLGIMFQAVS